MENKRKFQYIKNYIKNLTNKRNRINSPFYESSPHSNSITSDKIYKSKSLQNISITFIAKPKKDKYNTQSIINEYSTNPDSKSIINNNLQVPVYKTRKNDSDSRKTQKFRKKIIPYKRKITKFIQNYENNKKLDLTIENQEELLYNNDDCYNSTIISDYIYNTNFGYDCIDLNEYGKNKKEYSLFDNYYLDKSYKDNSIYKKSHNKNNSVIYKNNSVIYKTPSKSMIKKNNSYVKTLCSSFNIIRKNNDNKNNKVLRELKLYDKKLKEQISQNQKISELNSILIRDNKELSSKVKSFNAEFKNNSELKNNLTIQKQLSLIYENSNYNNNWNKNINKAKLFFILQEKFIKKEFNNKLLLFKYFNILYLYSKLNNYNNSNEKSFIISKNANLFVEETKNMSKNNNKRNKLLKFIITNKNLRKSAFVYYFENWKYKSKILWTINFVKEKKKKKKEKSKQRRIRKKNEITQNSWSNKDKNKTIKNINYINNINCYDEKNEDYLWEEYGSEYSEDEEKNVEKKKSK